ncbi:MAG: 2,3-bisphosphoglycerate-independent phosphoglycerate mutase [Mycoplasma sp.]
MRNKVLLTILDGVGYSPKVEGNAVYLAKTPNLDKLMQIYPHELISASGKDVGLPAGQMGNSEVGHLNIGAGRIVYTGLSLINKAIEDKVYASNPAFNNAFKWAKEHKSKLHIMGLVSHGGVHSDYQHITELLKAANQFGLEPIMHIFTDGRDVDPHAFEKDLVDFIKVCKKYQVKIASISGRYYAMDRDQRWERIEQAYETILGRSKQKFEDLAKYVENSYKNNITDEFIIPAMNGRYEPKNIVLSDNDAVIFANFRPDRARQLTHCIIGSSYYEYKPKITLKNIYMVTMSQYEGLHPNDVAFMPMKLNNVLGEVIEKNNMSQLRISETEKYAHVTFFFDGGKEIDYKNEKKILIPSPKVATYDLKPSMSANEITDNLVANLGKFDVIIVNYANGDMVGHTGNLEASIKAVESLDVQIGRLYEKCQELGVTMFIIADHGNVEKMLTEDHKPVTKHTTNPVWFILTDDNYEIAKHGKLANIAPSILSYLNVNIPLDMNEKPIISLKNGK